MFYKESNDTYLGETTISNIFIDIYMPMAHGSYVKVYLLGYKYAHDTKNAMNFNNKSISKNLNIPISEVNDAWKFWESKSIIRIHKGDDEENYSVEFFDLDKMYRENLSLRYTQNIENTILNIDENKRQMFNEINKIIGRYLDSSEKLKILDIQENFNLSCDMIIYAYEQIKEKGEPPKPIAYMEKIFRGWYDSKLYNLDDIKQKDSQNSNRYKIYKEIFTNLGFYRNPSKQEKIEMDKWLDEFNFSLEVILYACTKSVNSANISITFINSYLKKWYENNLKTVDEIKAFEEAKKQDSKKIKQTNYNNNYNKNYKNTGLNVHTRHHEIEQTYREYTEEELEEMFRTNKKHRTVGDLNER